jgi:hypothetical protein
VDYSPCLATSHTTGRIRPPYTEPCGSVTTSKGLLNHNFAENAKNGAGQDIVMWNDLQGE